MKLAIVATLIASATAFQVAPIAKQPSAVSAITLNAEQVSRRDAALHEERVALAEIFVSEQKLEQQTHERAPGLQPSSCQAQAVHQRVQLDDQQMLLRHAGLGDGAENGRALRVSGSAVFAVAPARAFQ